MISLATPIQELKNVGPRNISKLKKLGIQTVRELLWHFPARYEDYRDISTIDSVEPGQKVNIVGNIIKMAIRQIFPRRMIIVSAIVEDDTGRITAVWFNQPYIANTLKEGVRVSLAGKVTLTKKGLQLSSPTYEKINTQYFEPQLKHTGGLIPVYPETEGITSKYLRFLIKPIIDKINIPDMLPGTVSDKLGFPDVSWAIKNIHYPSTLSDAEKARERLAFDDLLLFQFKALLERRKINQYKSIPVPLEAELIKEYISKLPFELTGDQKIAIYEILKDLEKSYPMNRLLEGDVGSGKTVVAAICALETVHRGYQAVFMAPTEVLANQHFRTIRNLTYPFGTSVALLTSNSSRINDDIYKKPALKKLISEGKADIVIGTHAVIQKDVKFNKLALVIIDEQHRFGINQRKALVRRTESVPHLLSMTATPIPRSLALTIYGDLDISIIKEKPKNRRKIITRIISPEEREEAYNFISSQVKNGRQVFVVCPRIELAKKEEGGEPKKQTKMDSIWAEVKAVQEEHKKLSGEIFPGLRVAMLHGKLKPKEKQEIMADFKNEKIDILVATSVIEVGVDIPNASIMMIESAERFGLAQLHQFRGRVGRAEHQSYCLLFTSSGMSNTRLKALIKHDDGFRLAEQDMATRGPGEFFGIKQSGMADLAMASLANVELIKKARATARALLKDDPSIKKLPLLKERLDQIQKLVHFE